MNSFGTFCGFLWLVRLSQDLRGVESRQDGSEIILHSRASNQFRTRTTSTNLVVSTPPREFCRSFPNFFCATSMTPLVSCIFIYHVSMRRCVYGVRRAGLARSPPGRVGCTSPSLAGDLFFRKIHFLLVPANMGETGHKHYDNKIPVQEDSDGAVSEAPSFWQKEIRGSLSALPCSTI